MQLEIGNIFESNCLIKLCTANSTIARNGKLVMGAGNAKEMRDKYPGVDEWAARQILDKKKYGLLISQRARIGLFQTKYNWRDPSPVELIEYSTELLCSYAKENPNHLIGLPFPGIGYGGRKISEILPIIISLPDNVIVFMRNKMDQVESIIAELNDYISYCREMQEKHPTNHKIQEVYEAKIETILECLKLIGRVTDGSSESPTTL